MSVGIEGYSQAEFDHALDGIMADMTAHPKVAQVEKPRAVLLGGQSGAGKTTLHHVFADAFRQNMIIVNGDAYRAFHPRFHELQEEHGDEAVSYTAPWAGKMTEALVDRLSRLGYNLIIEGTLRTAEVPMGTAQLLRERGYGVSLVLVAVKPEISLVSCQARYEQMRIAGTVPRATDPAHHRKIVDQIVGNLAVLEGSGLFDAIELYSRSGSQVYPGSAAAQSASEALREVLFGPWSDEERAHLAYLERQLERLRQQ